MKKEKNNYIVILAGGGGTRLWPKSRERTPKQFLQLFNNKTLLQETFDRVKSFVPKTNIYIVAGFNQADQIKNQLSKVPGENILVEPAASGTAAAAGFAAAHIYQRNPAAVISTLASDHYIPEREKFLNTLLVATKAAKKGSDIVTIGIEPTHAHTGFGYIHFSKAVFKVDDQEVYKVEKFTEKPNKDLAKKYIKAGNYLWNANINSYKAKTLLSSLKKYMPKLSLVLEALEVSQFEFEESYKKLSPEPIDTGVLEKANNVLVVKGGFSWYDIGDWGVLHSLLKNNKDLNVFLGAKNKLLSLDTKNCLIESSNRLIATVGLKDIVIIDTPDVLLVASKKKAQDVKKLVEALKEGNKREYL